MANKVTIADIARLAGVSKTTVSRFLNGKFDGMSEMTRRHIAQTVRAHDYRPSRRARALRQQNSSLIGIVVADLSNSYTSRLLAGIIKRLRDTSYQPLIMDSENSKDSEQKNLLKVIDEQVDGLIFQPLGHEATDYEALAEEDFPIVQIDRYVEPLAWPAVVSDNFVQSKNLAKLALDKGYKQILLISAPVHEVSVRLERYEGLENALIGKDVVLEELLTTEAHLKAKLKTALESPLKTVIYAFNGDVLFDTVKFLKTGGYRIPEDVGLMGYDDGAWAELVEPAITSAQQDPSRIGHRAADYLLGQIKKDAPAKAPEIIYIDSQLYERDSL